MSRRPPEDLYPRFLDRTLPKPEWTHEAHLVVCRHALAERSPAEATVFLRDRIRSYNEATGVENTDSSGYHETITRYYVGAVHHLSETPLDSLVDAAECALDAPLRHWTRDRLFSVEARRGWVEPDRLPLPWPAVDGAGPVAAVSEGRGGRTRTR